MLMNGSNVFIGGVFEDHDADWLCDYFMTIGKDTIFKVETRFVLEGLCVAWEKTFENRIRM